MQPIIRPIDLSQLMVNTENPRFEMVSSQRDAIINMINDQKTKLEKLAIDMLDNGMNPGDPPYVAPHTKEKKKYVVLEGNRRIICLKLLANPNLIPDKNKSMLNNFQKLSKRYFKNPIDKVDCLVFGNDEDALRWIRLKHTGPNDGVGTVNWDAQQKQRFEERVVGKSSYAMQIIDFLSKQDDFDPGLKKKLPKVKSSSLLRLVSDPDFRDTVGIETQNGKVVTRYEPSEIVKALNKVIRDLLRSDFTVKDIYYKDDRIGYIETFKKNDLPDKTRELDGVWELTSPNPPVFSSPPKKKRKKSKSLSTTRKGVIPKNAIMRISYPRVNKIYHELKDIDLEYFCNAGAVTLRVFVEFSVDSFIESLNITSVSKDSKLTKKVQVVSQYLKENGHLDRHKLKGINSAVANPNNLMSIDTFHAYVHNKDFQPEPSSIKLTWDNIEPFITKIWDLI